MNTDVMSILIEKDMENEESVDYFFASNIYAKDPRDNGRNLCLGKMRGLFRITKADLEPHLLLSIEPDRKMDALLGNQAK